MRKEKFTRGTWVWYNNLSGEKIGISDGGKDVLYVNHSESIVIPREKDAYLIAAAPDLYYAIKKMQKIILDDDLQETVPPIFWEISAAALTKAQGES